MVPAANSPGGPLVPGTQLLEGHGHRGGLQGGPEGVAVGGGSQLGGSGGGQSSSEEALLPLSAGNEHSDPLPLGTCLWDTVRAWSPKY